MAKVQRHNLLAALLLQAFKRFGGSLAEFGTGTLSQQEWYEAEQRLDATSTSRARSDVLITKGTDVLHIDVTVKALNPQTEWWRAQKQEAELARLNGEYVQFHLADVAQWLREERRPLDEDPRDSERYREVLDKVKKRLAGEDGIVTPVWLEGVKELIACRRKDAVARRWRGQPPADADEQQQADEENATAKGAPASRHVKAISYYLSRLTNNLRSKLDAPFKRKVGKMVKFVRRDQMAPFVLSVFGLQHKANAAALPYPHPGTDEYAARMSPTPFGQSKDFRQREALRKLMSLRLLKAIAQSVGLGQGKAVRWRHQRDVETQLALAPAWDDE